MNLEITQINVLPIDGVMNCIAIVQLELNGCFRLTGMKLFYNAELDRYYIEYPRNPSNRKNRCYFYPTNNETTEAFVETIVKAYKEQIKD